MRTSCDNHCYDLLRFYIHCMLYVLLKYGAILKILFHFFFHPLIQFCNLWKCKADDFFSYHIYYIQRICAVCGINVVMFPACGSTGVRFIQILKLSHKNSFISIKIWYRILNDFLKCYVIIPFTCRLFTDIYIYK